MNTDTETPGYFNYVHSCDINENFQLKIGTFNRNELEGKKSCINAKGILENPCLQGISNYSELIVECELFYNGSEISLPIVTSHKHFTLRWFWNEWLEFPLQYYDLPRSTLLLMTIYNYIGPRNKVAIGGTTIPLFDKYGLFHKGLLDLRVWPNVKAHLTETPGIGALIDDKNDLIYNLIKLVKKRENGEIMEVDWIDRLIFTEINLINDKEKRLSNFMYLMVEFPKVKVNEVEYYILWWDSNTPVKYKNCNKFLDPDLEFVDNLHHSKHHILARSLKSKDAKPSSNERNKLTEIINYPPTHQLLSREQDLIWQYSHFLSTQPNALCKFLKCVNWDIEKETELALNLLDGWIPATAHEALELLGPEFKHPKVRKYAVDRLSKLSDNELFLFLLQLVQALKYEDIEVESINLLDMSYYSVESDEDGKEPIATITEPRSSSLDEMNVNDLSSFLIQRACNNKVLASYFYWYLRIECEENSLNEDSNQEAKTQEMYLWVMNCLKSALQLKCPSTWKMLQRQQSCVDDIVALIKSLEKESGRMKKVEKLQEYLSDPESKLNSFECLPLPLDPEISICGTVAAKANIFKSALEPCKLTFKTADGGEYITIFKHGDDLRQDQLIIQIITLLNELLLKENMNMQLTPYKVLATSKEHGFVQYVDSTSIAEILRTHGSIQAFLKHHAPQEGVPYGISKEVMDNYIKSCAGYCVITYILGIGDRHFDNLLMTKEGRLFHIDFGYILGRDPKPLPPAMKVTKEMVDGMGGLNSQEFLEFKQLCYTIYMQLRRHSSLVLNLFNLMVDSSITDIALEPDKATKKVEDKFHLNLTEEQALTHISEVIDSSLAAVMAVVVEQMHRFAQYMRK